MNPMFDVGCSMLDVRCWMFDVGCWMLNVGFFPIYPTELLPHVHTRFENSKMHSDDDRNGQTRHSPISHLANPRLPGQCSKTFCIPLPLEYPPNMQKNVRRQNPFGHRASKSLRIASCSWFVGTASDMKAAKTNADPASAA